jgi:hypothetical protein
MNPSNFDDLTKALASSTSRRQALRTILAASVGGLLGIGGISTAFGRHHRRRAKPAKPSPSGSPGNSNCAKFCAAVYGPNTPAANQCTSDAAHNKSGNLCSQCGGNSSRVCCNKNGNFCDGTAGAFCCQQGQTCCGMTCCTSVQTCLNNTTCCPTGDVCGTSCGCPPDRHCDNGACVPNCAAAEGTCSVDGDCCSGTCCKGLCCGSGQLCRSNGTCATPCSIEGICSNTSTANCGCLALTNPPICAQNPGDTGAPCSTDDDCPKGTVCNPAPATGTCFTAC